MDFRSFHKGEQAAQARWRTDRMWDEVRRERLLWDQVPPEFHARLEGAPFFFLATSGPDGRCDCSFKGGGPGIVRVLDARRIAFPDFDGNGAFMSIGNILLNPYVGCLFIDFNDGARLRINGRAEVREDDAVAGLFPDCRRVVVVAIEQVVPNCSRHIPRLLPADA
ncbi:MAG: pyridoxamine 5'-phosphate oxidase [Betaproteobacteria bacterium]|nr:pyridoxamine 5'-phosphate oxidase [Betaproteobacteria bacterium]